MRYREKRKLKRATVLVRRSRAELGECLREMRRDQDPLAWTAISDSRVLLESLQELLDHVHEGTLDEYIQEGQEARKTAEN